MYIRPTEPADRAAILRVYDRARTFMRENGNPDQWGADWPPEPLVDEDIREGRSYAAVGRDGAVHGVFAFLTGEDPTYQVIEGAWPDSEPYGTIHRIAGDGTEPGLFRACLAFCRTRCGRIRADTHRDNAVMRHVLEKNGFRFCGIIYVGDGTPRLAYAYTEPAASDLKAK